MMVGCGQSSQRFSAHATAGALPAGSYRSRQIVLAGGRPVLDPAGEIPHFSPIQQADAMKCSFRSLNLSGEATILMYLTVSFSHERISYCGEAECSINETEVGCAGVEWV